MQIRLTLALIALLAGGMVFVNSGYTVDGGAPGNVVLAFGVD